MRPGVALVMSLALGLLPPTARAPSAQALAQTRPDERAQKLIAGALDALGGLERVRSLQ